MPSRLTTHTHSLEINTFVIYTNTWSGRSSQQYSGLLVDNCVYAPHLKQPEAFAVSLNFMNSILTFLAPLINQYYMYYHDLYPQSGCMAVTPYFITVGRTAIYVYIFRKASSIIF